MLIQPYLLKTKLVYNYPETNWVIGSNSTEDKYSMTLSEKVGGQGQLMNSEELLVNSIASHLLQEFTMLAEKNKLQYEKIEINSEINIQPNKSGSAEIKTIHFQFCVFHTSHREKAELLAQQAKKDSSIYQKVQFEKSFAVIIVQ